MDHTLKIILDEVASIQSALLRFRNKEGQQNLQVKIAVSIDDSLHCVSAGKVPLEMKIRDKKVHLIQKHHDDYFFISGFISEEVMKNPRVLSVDINKASWFVRKSKGSVCWFSEKHSFEKGFKEMRPAS